MKRLVLAVLLASGTALAAPEPRELARERYAEGVQRYKAREFAEALAAFREAYDATKNYRVLYNIAQVEAQLQDYASSIASFERYLAEGGTDVDAKRSAEVRAEIERMNGLLATITVRSDALGARVFLDDVDRGAAPLTVRVNVGPRTVRVSAEGYVSRTERLLLSPGDTKDVDLSLVLAPPPPKPVVVERTVVRSAPVTPPAWRRARWAFGIGTAAFAAGAATTGALALGRNSALGDALAQRPANPDRVASLRHQLRTFDVASDVCFIAGGVGLAGLVVSLLGPFGNAKRASFVTLRPTFGGASLEVRYP